MGVRSPMAELTESDCNAVCLLPKVDVYLCSEPVRFELEMSLQICDWLPIDLLIGVEVVETSIEVVDRPLEH